MGSSMERRKDNSRSGRN